MAMQNYAKHGIFSTTTTIPPTPPPKKQKKQKPKKKNPPKILQNLPKTSPYLQILAKIKNIFFYKNKNLIFFKFLIIQILKKFHCKYIPKYSLNLPH